MKRYSVRQAFGSMDGATKFVKGDAIMSIIVTFINLIGDFSWLVKWYGRLQYHNECI